MSKTSVETRNPDLDNFTGFTGRKTIRVSRDVPDLMRSSSSLAFQVLMKAADVPAPSNINANAPQSVDVPSFDMTMAMVLRNFNVHHSTCLEVLPSLTFGQGLRNDKLYEKLDPLCTSEVSGIDGILHLMGDNYWELGAGWIEVVREDPKDNAPIRGLHWARCDHIGIVEDKDDPRNTGYTIAEGVHGSGAWGDTVPMHAKFGHLEQFLATHGITGSDRKKVSELINIRQLSTRSNLYGRPRWLAATASMELVQCATQHEFNFYFNRGVPEFAFIVTGGVVEEADWQELEEKLLDHVGLNDSHQSLAINLSGEDLKVEVVRLAMDGEQEHRFTTDIDTLALMVVSAHGVPPALGGLVLPGRAGATNEQLNSFLTFQLGTGQNHQRRVSKILAGTLGDPKCNGGLGLTREDFLREETDPITGEKSGKNNAFKTVLDDIDVGKADTLARMKEEGAVSTRDLSQGTKQRGGENKDNPTGKRTAS